MRPSQIFFYALSVILLGVIIFLPSFGWQLHAWLSPTPGGEPNEVLAQNAALQAQIAQYATVANALPVIPSNYIPAIVYSRYPTNFRNEFLVTAGSREGIATGKAVVIEAPSSTFTFIGRVVSVFADTSLVQTIFDPGFKMPVRIGPHAYDGLLVGGLYPRIISISKNAPIQANEVVVSADSSFPYGLPIAEVNGVNLSSDSLFQEATLNFAYDINAVKIVVVGR